MGNSEITGQKFTAGTAPAPQAPKISLKIRTLSGVMASPSELKYYFSGKEDTKKFFYVYENAVIKNETEEEKRDNLVAYLVGEAFKHYFNNFKENNALLRR